MKKQSLFEKIVYILMGGLFFFGYYLLMNEVFKIDPFKGMAIAFTIYFITAIPLFAKSGQFLSEKIKSIFAIPNIVMPLAYIFSPIIFIYTLFKKNN